MARTDDLTALDLGALLCSRVCHDIISPVGAINNGLEVLDEDGGEDMQAFAMDLIRKSAKQASAKLQFARLAFGAAGSAGAEIDTGDAQSVAEGYMAGEKATLTWTAQRVLMAKNRVKLLLNLILIANGMIPRGGTIDVTIEGTAEAPVFRFDIRGINVRVSDELRQQIDGEVEPDLVNAHIVQPVYTGLLSRACGMPVEWTVSADQAIITAQST